MTYNVFSGTLSPTQSINVAALMILVLLSAFLQCSLITFCIRRSQGKCVLVTAVCVSVCLSLAAFPHYCMDPDVTWGMVGGAR